MLTVAGTGSRSLVSNQEQFNKVFNYLVELLNGAKAKHGNAVRVMSGMAEGFDEALAKAAMHVGIELVAAIPNKGYSAYYWQKNSLLGRDRMSEFQELAKYANLTGGVIYVSNSIYVNGRHSNFVRNEYMVDNSDIVWVYNPASSGTAHCYSYCRRVGRRTFIIEI